MKCASCGEAVSGWSVRTGPGGTLLCKNCYGTEAAEAAIQARLASKSEPDQAKSSTDAALMSTGGVEYDQRVIKEFAASVYAQASAAEAAATIIGLIVGAAVGYLGGSLMTQSSGAALVVVLASGIIGGAIGFQNGKAKALSLRLEAQMALCQAEIEKNTKTAGALLGQKASEEESAARRTPGESVDLVDTMEEPQ